jgi:exosortase
MALFSSETSPVVHDHKEARTIPGHVWRTVASIVVWCLAAGFLLWPRLVYLFHAWWTDSFYSFCFLVLPISLFITWTKRAEALRAAEGPSMAGIAMVLGATTAVVLLDRAGGRLTSMTPVFIIAIGGGSIWTVYGLRTVRVLAFPLAFLLFLLPLPLGVVLKMDFPLQLLCARITASAAHVMGIASRLEGARIYLSHFTMTIAPECNGLRSSLAMLALSVLYAYFQAGRPWHKVTLVTLAVPLAYVANFVRLVCDVVVTNMLGAGFYKYEQTWDLTWGFLTFLLAAWLLVLVARMMGCGHIQDISQA